MDLKLLVDIIGWFGSLELLFAYLLVSSERLSPATRSYQWLNFTGSIFLLVNAAYYGAFPSSFLNIVWGLIALATLYRLTFKRAATT